MRDCARYAYSTGVMEEFASKNDCKRYGMEYIAELLVMNEQRFMHSLTGCLFSD
jgi:hypothetical protein